LVLFSDNGLVVKIKYASQEIVFLANVIVNQVLVVLLAILIPELMIKNRVQYVGRDVFTAHVIQKINVYVRKVGKE
jgi:hypothetical protein